MCGRQKHILQNMKYLQTFFLTLLSVIPSLNQRLKEVALFNIYLFNSFDQGCFTFIKHVYKGIFDTEIENLIGFDLLRAGVWQKSAISWPGRVTLLHTAVGEHLFTACKKNSFQGPAKNLLCAKCHSDFLVSFCGTKCELLVRNGYEDSSRLPCVSVVNLTTSCLLACLLSGFLAFFLACLLSRPWSPNASSVCASLLKQCLLTPPKCPSGPSWQQVLSSDQGSQKV